MTPVRPAVSFAALAPILAASAAGLAFCFYTIHARNSRIDALRDELLVQQRLVRTTNEHLRAEQAARATAEESLAAQKQAVAAEKKKLADARDEIARLEAQTQEATAFSTEAANRENKLLAQLDRLAAQNAAAAETAETPAPPSPAAASTPAPAATPPAEKAPEPAAPVLPKAPEPAAPNLSTAEMVALPQLLDDYAKNQLDAERVYTYRSMILVARAGDLRSTEDGGTALELVPWEAGALPLRCQCYFGRADKELLAAIRRGGNVAVVGQFRGRFRDNLYMVNTRLADPAAVAREADARRKALPPGSTAERLEAVRAALTR